MEASGRLTKFFNDMKSLGRPVVQGTRAVLSSVLGSNECRDGASA